MTIWVVRAGKYGDQEAAALEQGFVCIGWDEMPDLSQYKSKEALTDGLVAAFPDAKPKTVLNHAGQLWNFVHTLAIGDIVALPLKGQPAIAFGKVVGNYEYHPEAPSRSRHRRAVKWIGEPIPRKNFDQDLLYSFGSVLTVFRVHRNDAEARINKTLKTGGTPSIASKSVQSVEADGEDEVDLLLIAKQKISDYIGQKFKGHKMEELVAAILQARGYSTFISPEGADDGVDILAARGSLGFDAPRLCVQVKSSDSPVSREILDQLQGVMQKFNADHGLLVSWGGFKSTVEREAKRLYFNVRLWNDQDLVRELQAVYHDLPEEIRADIPLTQTWVLVEEE